MSWLNDLWIEAAEWVPALVTFFYFALTLSCIAWVLMTKTDSTSAVAWCLLIILLPFVGSVFFYFFGYQHVDRPLRRKRRHKKAFQMRYGPAAVTVSMPVWGACPDGAVKEFALSESLARLADTFGAYPLTQGNHIEFYHDGPPAFAAMLEAIRGARRHIHLEFFIFHAYEIGDRKSVV